MYSSTVDTNWFGLFANLLEGAFRDGSISIAPEAALEVQACRLQLKAYRRSRLLLFELQQRFSFAKFLQHVVGNGTFANLGPVMWDSPAQ